MAMRVRTTDFDLSNRASVNSLGNAGVSYGFLPFLDTKPAHIYFQADLKSEESITNNSSGGAIVNMNDGNNDQSQVYDSELGMQPNNGTWRITQPDNGLGGSYQDLDKQGQITFQLRTSQVGLYEPLNGSNGEDGSGWAAARCALSAQTGSLGGAAGIMIFNIDGSKTFSAQGAKGGVLNNWNKGKGNAAGVATQITTMGRGDWVTVEIGWWTEIDEFGNEFVTNVMRVDDRITEASTQLPASNRQQFFNNFYIGSDRGAARDFEGLWIRNLQISSLRPIFQVHPMFHRVFCFGDSYINATTDQAVTRPFARTSRSGDHALPYSIERYLNQRNYHIWDLVSLGAGGHHIIDSQANNLQTFRATMLAENPTFVCFQAGANDTNDTAAVFDGTFENDLLDHIDSIMAHPTVRGMTVGTTNNLGEALADRLPTVIEQNASVFRATDRWKTANPSRAKFVEVADLYTDLGGEKLLPNVLYGDVQGNDDLHTSALGAMINGYGHGKKMIGMVS